MKNSGSKRERNSLIELYRFIFAIWVVFYHDYLIMPKSSLFNHGYLAVDFFFILTGFFLLGGMKIFFEMPFFKGFFKFSWKRILSLCPALLIGFVFSAIYFFTEPSWMILDIFGYLWYIPQMFIGFTFVYVAKRLIKSEKAFTITCAAVCLVSFILLFTVCEGWGLFRALGGINLGILTNKIPKISFDGKKFNPNIIFTILMIFLTVGLAAMPKSDTYVDFVMIVAIFPLLLCFTAQVNIKFKPFNFLGSLSFGLYAYQTILRVLEHFGVVTYFGHLLLILIIATMLDRIGVDIYKHFKNKRKAAKNALEGNI
ncbi:MAG: hypothetical protein J6K39_01595 [Clostridia bacterium]|nr:hypothetical protein [Clostridia bacterium]